MTEGNYQESLADAADANDLNDLRFVRLYRAVALFSDRYSCTLSASRSPHDQQALQVVQIAVALGHDYLNGVLDMPCSEIAAEISIAQKLMKDMQHKGAPVHHPLCQGIEQAIDVMEDLHGRQENGTAPSETLLQRFEFSGGPERPSPRVGDTAFRSALTPALPPPGRR